ncbi:hypothetical protein PsorP6_000533 [Peronosclerospora sorghi]|uniref:Uncharacterized protein n=1 Tax=Peronosclerospora sorghi TaxID=230839 RepID=A0ACC0WR42_9STRA|nr:hypothetical protein PsorP6_000533 [Peronosclerospora sorghi]
MASRDLVGRPLVPFFDSDDKVNNSLRLAEGDCEREEMDVDARVWDKKLGYFVYPSEQNSVSSTSVKIAAATREDSGCKQLLTPSMMLSSSAPKSLDGDVISLRPNAVAAEAATLRSSSVKRGSKQKTRFNTSGRQQNDKDGVEDASTASKRWKSKGGNLKSNSAQLCNNPQPRNGNDQLSASGKWAWSAFQSSPDPSELPMPPFLVKTTADSLNSGDEPFAVTTSSAKRTPLIPLPAQHYVTAPTAPPTSSGSFSQQPPQLAPTLMPSAPLETANPSFTSVELSMTQDLRKLLNIEGG